MATCGQERHVQPHEVGQRTRCALRLCCAIYASVTDRVLELATTSEPDDFRTLVSEGIPTGLAVPRWRSLRRHLFHRFQAKVEIFPKRKDVKIGIRKLVYEFASDSSFYSSETALHSQIMSPHVAS